MKHLVTTTPQQDVMPLLERIPAEPCLRGSRGVANSVPQARKGLEPALRFESKVRQLPGGCHLWMGHRTVDGYGQFRVGTVVYAHRYAYEQVHGTIPKGMQIDHICNLRFCVNPLHLQMVTPQQNNMLIGIRTGDSDVYVWERALDEGLAVELSDLQPDGRLALRAHARAQW